MRLFVNVEFFIRKAQFRSGFYEAYFWQLEVPNNFFDVVIYDQETSAK